MSHHSRSKKRTQSACIRTLTVLAQDPAITYKGGALTVQLDIPMERLSPGPRGARVHVVDYDASTGTLYKPMAYDKKGDRYADVTDTASLVGDQRFHSQNVYAIVMATLARFEHALGRRASWALPCGGSSSGAPPGHGHVLKIAPHAFAEANAYYSRRDEGIFFGHFPGSRGHVFSCLSHDVIAHETAHALLDGLRPRFSDPSSPDQAAFHEGFADIVALLSVLRHEKLLGAAFAPNTARIPAAALKVESLRRSTLLGLAEQMGREMAQVRGNALRASTLIEPSRDILETEEFLEPHRRGEVLVAAMMDAFLDVWVRRLGPLGLDERPPRPVDRGRVIEEGAAAASHLLTMAIRALDYTPPVDLHFAEYLSALLTADRQLYPDDSRYGYRQALLRWFAAYGINPVTDGAGPEPGSWRAPRSDISLDRNHFESLQRDPDEMFHFVWQNRAELELHPEAYTYVPSVRPCTRVGADGFALRETVAEYVQTLALEARELARLRVRKPRGMPDAQRITLHGGGALIFDEFGRLKFHIRSKITSKKQGSRLQHLWNSGFFDERRSARRRFAQAHLERAMQRPLTHQERW